jgi:hypothetical protein
VIKQTWPDEINEQPRSVSCACARNACVRAYACAYELMKEGERQWVIKPNH